MLLRILFSVGLVGLLAFPIAFAVADQPPYPDSQEALDAEYAAFQWANELAEYPLPSSHSHISLPPGFSLLLGTDARRFVFLNNGIDFPGTEAVIVDEQTGTEIDFDYAEEGHVKDDDWSDVDADEFITQMKEDQIATNEERRANGQTGFEVIGWVTEPSYDSATHIAYYALELGNEQSHWLNAVAVKLGRHGYHQVTWIGEIDTYKSGTGKDMLSNVLNSHSYDAGHRYVDFKEGDNVAAYGIAGLVAAVAGIKLSKGFLAAAIAFLAIAGKKLLILVIPAVIAVRAGIKKFFRGRE